MSSAAPETKATGTAASRWAFAGIMFLAAFLRLYRLDLVSVTDDTALQVLLASTAWSDWPLAGADTEEVRSSAFLVSAIAVANLIWWHPNSAVLVVVVLNLLSVAMVYRLGAGQFGRLAAAIAALLYASSPWAVLSARTLLPESCLALFSVWLVDVSLRWLDRKQSGQLVLMVLLALAIPQVHFSGICAPVWLMFVLYCGRKHVSKVGLAAGGILGAALWTPWIVFQQRANWIGPKTWAGQALQAPEEHGRAFVHSLDHLQALLHSAGFDYWFGASPSHWLEYFPPWLSWSLSASAVILILLFVSGVWRMTRTPEPKSWLLLLWIALSVIAGGLFRTGFTPENMLIAYPIPFCLLGSIAVRLQETIPRRIRYLPTVTLIAVSLVHVLFLAGLARFVADGESSTGGRYELTYRQRQIAIQSVLDDGGAPVRLIGPFFGWNPAYEHVLLYEQPAVTGSGDDDDLVRYWIDEEPPVPGMSEDGWRNRKERQINQQVAEYLHTPPDWEIERHWTIEGRQIYRLRFVRKLPLR